MGNFLFGGMYEVKVPDIAAPATKTVKKYYSIAGRRIAMHDGTQLRCLPGRRIAMHDGTQLRCLPGDHLSSTLLVLDAAGALLSEQRYTPFGQVRAGTGSITPASDFSLSFLGRGAGGEGRQLSRAGCPHQLTP